MGAGADHPAGQSGQPLGAVDAPAVVLPNGNVLFTAGPITIPATFQAPTFFFEYDPAANTHRHGAGGGDLPRRCRTRAGC